LQIYEEELKLIQKLAERIGIQHGTVTLRTIVKYGKSVETHIEADHKIIIDKHTFSNN